MASHNNTHSLDTNDASIHTVNKVTDLTIVSYNLNGFNQGTLFLRYIWDGDTPPDIVFIQENWLTPANKHKMNSFSKQSSSYGISAMTNAIDNGILRGSC